MAAEDVMERVARAWWPQSWARVSERPRLLAHAADGIRALAAVGLAIYDRERVIAPAPEEGREERPSEIRDRALFEARALAAEEREKRLREAAQRVVNQVGPLIEAAAQSSVIQGTTDEAMVVLAVEYLSDLRAALSTAMKEPGNG